MHLPIQRLQSYRVVPTNVPLPAALAGQLRRLAQTAIEASLVRNTRQHGREGSVTWRLAADRMEMTY